MNPTFRYRSLKRSTDPVVEPVTLAEAKAHCRVDTNSDDAYIASLISVAREWVEDAIDRSLVTQRLTMKMDAFPAEIELPRPPIASAETATAVTITYTIADRSTVTLDSTKYRVDRDATPAVIRPLYNQTWPSHLLDQNSVTVTWWAGYGDGRQVPTRAKHAMLMLIGHWYERRTAVDSVSATDVPYGVKDLLAGVSWGSYT